MQINAGTKHEAKLSGGGGTSRSKAAWLKGLAKFEVGGPSTCRRSAGPEHLEHFLVGRLCEDFVVASDRVEIRIYLKRIDFIRNFFKSLKSVGRGYRHAHDYFLCILLSHSQIGR